MASRSRTPWIVFAAAVCAGADASAEGVVLPYGAGCPGGHGLLQMAVEGVVEPGATVSVAVSDARPGTEVRLLIGRSNEDSIFGPLPLDLSGLPAFGEGCALWTSAERRLTGAADAQGRATFELDLPADPEFRGFLQSMAVDAENPLEYVVSAAAEVRLTGGPASVAGLISGAGGAPLPGARVTLFTDDLSTFLEQRSAADGRYLFEGVTAGVYRLGAALRDHDYVEVEQTLSGEAVTVDLELAPETHPGRWTIIGDTGEEFLDATDIGILKPDGRIFYCHDTTDPLDFDPVSGGFTLPPSSGEEQGCMNATLLDDGRILFVGGQSPADPGAFRNAIPWVKTYDDANGWIRLPDLNHVEGRWYPGLVRLADGGLLVMGGGTAPNAERTATAELFDFTTQTWTYTAAMNNPNEFSPSALLTTGEVLRTWYPPELFDPATQSWRPTGNFVQTERFWPGHSDHSLIVLSEGRALAVGVSRGDLPDPVMGELYDPVSETWSLTANTDLARKQAEVVYLPDGRVLVAGGETESLPAPVPDVLGVVRWTDLYDPDVDRWRRVADMLQFREYHAITLLVPDGRVLTTGGTHIKFQVGPTSNDVEAFEPPYLFRGIRPQIRSLSTTTPARGSTLTLEVFPQTTLTEVVLMGMQSHTHWVDAGVPRRVSLTPTQTETNVEVVLPTDPNLLPLGWYLAFALVDDIPSEAAIVRVAP